MKNEYIIMSDDTRETKQMPVLSEEAERDIDNLIMDVIRENK